MARRTSSFKGKIGVLHLSHEAILDPLSHAVKHILLDENDIENRYVQEIRRLRSNQHHMANRLERIIYSLQRDLVDKYVVTLG